MGVSKDTDMVHKLYIMRTVGFIKVGVTSGLIEKRIKSVQTGTPTPIYVVTIFGMNTRQEAFSLEKAIHRKLENRNTFGEWFKNVRENSNDLREILHEYGIKLSDGKVINIQRNTKELGEIAQLGKSIDMAVKRCDMDRLIGVGLKIHANDTVMSIKKLDKQCKEALECLKEIL